MGIVVGGCTHARSAVAGVVHLDSYGTVAGGDPYEEVTPARPVPDGVGGEFGDADADVVGDPGPGLGAEQARDEVPRTGHRPRPAGELPLAREPVDTAYAGRFRGGLTRIGDSAAMIQACAAGSAG